MRFDVRDTRNKNWLWIRRELLRKHGDELGAHGIAVYAALASYAGQDNTAYPSMQSMADLIDCSRRTVQRSIKTLHDLGWVGYEQQHKEDGGQTSHLFYLLECPCESESPPRDTDSHPPVQESHPPCDTDAHEVETNEVEPQEEEGSSSSAPTREDSPSGDSLPDADIEIDPSLDFLPEDYEVYTSSIRTFIGEYAPKQFDQLLKRAWENVPFTWSDSADLVREHDWSVFVAAVVVAANEADRPNLRYLETIIESFNSPDCPNEHVDGDPKRRDAKQHPASNHERIATAVDAAFDDG